MSSKSSSNNKVIGLISGNGTEKTSYYEEMPPNLAQKVIDERKSKKNE